MEVVNKTIEEQEAELQKLEAEKEEAGKPEIPLIHFALNHPSNGKTYPVLRKKHKGMKQMFVPENQLINNDVVRMYNQMVKQFNNQPQVVQSGFISELNRLINFIRKQQLEHEAIEKLKAESKPQEPTAEGIKPEQPITPEDPNQTKLPLDVIESKPEEGQPVHISTDIPSTSDTTL